MFNFIRTATGRMGFEKAFSDALKLVRNGYEKEALAKFESLLQTHPTNVYLRHQTAILQSKLKKEIELPPIPSEKPAYLSKLK